MRPSRELQAMIDAARHAGVGLMRHFRRRGALRIEEKSRADFVSQADREAEATIVRRLGRAFPGCGFLAEEGAPEGPAAALRFVIDPLDGTSNFLCGVPHFAVSIALEREGKVTAGVVYDPAKGELFTAQRGAGAFLDGEPMAVLPARRVAQAMIGIGIPHANKPAQHARTRQMLAAIMRESAGVRRLGAAALDLAYVAAGRLGAFVELDLSPWDVAAGQLLVREGGGRVTAPDGGPLGRDVLATNGRLHREMVRLVAPAARRSSASPRR